MQQAKTDPSQTGGPYFAYCLTPEQYGYDRAGIASKSVAAPEIDGEHIRIEGRGSTAPATRSTTP